MRRLSLTARGMSDAHSTGEVEVVLLHVEHPDTGEIVRVSSDYTERLNADPLLYGTRSTWMGANPVDEPFLFVGMQMELPGDQEDVPFVARLVLANLNSELVKTLQSFTRPATAHICTVLAATPDLVEIEYTDLLLSAAEFDQVQIELTLSHEAVEDEPFPAQRMTKKRFPGSYK